MRTSAQSKPSKKPGIEMDVRGLQASSQKLHVHSSRLYPSKSFGRGWSSSIIKSQGYMGEIKLFSSSFEYSNVMSVFPVYTAFVPMNCMKPGADCPEAKVATKGFFLQEL
jgi:hypothetical protein